MKLFPLSFCAIVVMMGGTLLASKLSERHPPGALERPLDSIPTSLGPWRMVHSDELDPAVLEVLKPTAYLSRTYERDGLQLGLFIAYYAEQRAGENMHSPKNCLPGSGWEIWNFASAFVPTAEGPVKINRYSIQNGGVRKLVLYWYQSKDRVIASEYLGKIMLVHDALFKGTTAGSIVRIIVPDLPEASAEGERFGATVMREVQRCFGARCSR